MAIKSLLLKGNFTEADLIALSTTFRAAERLQPDQDFLFVIVDADLTLEEGRELIKRIFPRVDGENPWFQTINLSEL